MLGQLRHYLSFFNLGSLGPAINSAVNGYLAIFYAVATNDEGIVRAFAEHGADLNVVEAEHQIPLLAFAILMETTLQTDTTAMVLTLLSLGASARVIPSVFYSPFLDDPVEKMPLRKDDPGFLAMETKWCNDWLRPILTTSINLTQRYFNYKSINEPGPSSRQQQVAEVTMPQPF